METTCLAYNLTILLIALVSTWFWNCYQIDCIYIKNIDPFFFWEGTFEDDKEVIRSRKSKDRQHNGKTKKGQTTIYTVLHRKLKIGQQEH
jgi:uncharacterized protein involved in tolerance to divalent cations